MQKTKEIPATGTRTVYDGTLCDVCGRDVEEAEFAISSRFEMGWNIGEEGELLIAADVCYDCGNEVGVDIREMMAKLHTLIPHGSFRSSFGEWETTGEYVDE